MNFVDLFGNNEVWADPMSVAFIVQVKAKGVTQVGFNNGQHITISDVGSAGISYFQQIYDDNVDQIMGPAITSNVIDVDFEGRNK